MCTSNLDEARESGTKKGVRVNMHLFIVRLEVAHCWWLSSKVDVYLTNMVLLLLAPSFGWSVFIQSLSSLFSSKLITSVLCHWTWLTVVQRFISTVAFQQGWSDSERGWSFEVPSPPACLILHATGISTIDHGCRSVCRCLHRSVSLITHSHSSARLLISPRPLSLCLPSCSSLSLLLVPLLSPSTRSLSLLLSHTHFFN